MRYFKSKVGEVYAYNQEQIDKTTRLTEIENLVEAKFAAYTKALKQIQAEQEKLGVIEDIEDNAQEIEFIKVEIANLQAIINDYIKIKNELDLTQAVIYEMRENIQNFHEMTDEEIDAHINPPKPHEQLLAEAEEQKVHLLAQAASKISPLQDAVDLGIATESEISQLKAWKKFRVLVNRVDASLAPDIEWPEMP